MSSSLYIIYQAGVNHDTATRLMAAITNALNAGVTEINVLISSPGGNVFDGMNVASLIKSSSANIIIHNVGQIDSIAGVIFAAGNVRRSNLTSTFLFHGVMANFSGPSSLTEAQLEERLATLKRDRENIAKNISQYAGVNIDTVNDLMKAGSIITAQDALQIGLVQEICDAQIPVGAQIITIA